MGVNINFDSTNGPWSIFMTSKTSTFTAAKCENKARLDIDINNREPLGPVANKLKLESVNININKIFMVRFGTTDIGIGIGGPIPISISGLRLASALTLS